VVRSARIVADRNPATSVGRTTSMAKKSSRPGALVLVAARGDVVLLHELRVRGDQSSAASQAPPANLDWKPGWDQRLRSV